MRVEDMWRFVSERHRIYLKRSTGAPPASWTDDPILQRFRFCNMYRELDTVTDWLRRNWREPNADHPDLWHAFVVARHVNNVPMLEALGGATLPWDPDKFISIGRTRKAAGERVWSAAYIIGTRTPGDKCVYIADNVLTPMWEKRDKIRPQLGDTLTGWHMALGLWFGMASFMAAQVIADIKHVGVLECAKDWSTFCASGPGSRRGLNRVMGSPIGTPWQEDTFRLRLLELRQHLLPHFADEGWDLPDAQDVQNMLCEFDKYERTRLGEGKPKQLFRHGIYTDG
jgi:hypothetical protein